MPKFAVIGDPHATPTTLDKISELFDTVEELGLPTIWLGDFLDTKEVIRGKCLNMIYRRLLQSPLQHIVLIGNHDWFNLQCEEHSLECLKELDNVLVVDTLQEIAPGLHAIPYIHDQAALAAVLESIPEDTVLFGHLEVTGFDFGNGHMCESGTPIQSLEKFKRVISGHFHKAQETGNLLYLGTPFSHSFGESSQTKLIGVYDSDDNSISLTETSFPQHVTLHLYLDSEGTEIPPHKPNDYLRVILEGSQENIDRFDRSSYPEGTKYVERSTDQFSVDVVIDESQSNVSKFKNWATKIKGLDEETVKLGIEILESLK